MAAKLLEISLGLQCTCYFVHMRQISDAGATGVQVRKKSDAPRVRVIGVGAGSILHDYRIIAGCERMTRSELNANVSRDAGEHKLIII